MLSAMRAHNPNSTTIGSAVFARMTADCPYTLQWFACFPLKITPCHVGIWTSCSTWFIGPTQVRNANGNLVVSAVFAGLTSVTDWQSDRNSDRQTTLLVRRGVIMPNYVGYGKATQSFHVSTNNFPTICTFKTFNKISRLKSYILCRTVALQSAII